MVSSVEQSAFTIEIGSF